MLQFVSISLFFYNLDEKSTGKRQMLVEGNKNMRWKSGKIHKWKIWNNIWKVLQFPLFLDLLQLDKISTEKKNVSKRGRK